MKLKVRELVILGLMTAILFVAQVALSFLPNIELVSLLVIVYTLVFGPKVLYVIYAFAVLEGLLYGFSSWWITYLYIWTVLAGLTWCFRKMESTLGWAILSGAFGLAFGALCELSHFFFVGWQAMIASWVSGLMFDIAHCVGNFLAALALFKPLLYLLRKLAQRAQITEAGMKKGGLPSPGLSGKGGPPFFCLSAGFRSNRQSSSSS